MLLEDFKVTASTMAGGMCCRQCSWERLFCLYHESAPHPIHWAMAALGKDIISERHERTDRPIHQFFPPLQEAQFDEKADLQNPPAGLLHQGGGRGGGAAGGEQVIDQQDAAARSEEH